MFAAVCARAQVVGRSGGGHQFDVLLTTYEYLMGKADRPRLCRIAWAHMIIDEGHRLKNAGCKLNAELAHFRTGPLVRSSS